MKRIITVQDISCVMLFDCGASDYFGNGSRGVCFADSGFVDPHHVQRVYIPRSDGRYYTGL